MNSAASSQRAASTAPDGVIDARMLRDLACGDLLGHTAGHQLAQHGVQPAGDLGAGPAQIPVSLGPHLQHRRVIVTPGLPDTARAQRRDGNRAGIVGIVLVNVSRREQPHPGGQLRLHVQHPLTRGQQLLGQQMAHTLSAPGRPGPLRPGVRPRQQLLRLASAGTYSQLTQRLFGHINRHGRMRGLVRINSDHHCHHGCPPVSPLTSWARPWRARLIPGIPAGARASFEPRHGEAPASWHVVRKPSPRGRQAVKEPSPPGPLNATTPRSLPSRPRPAASAHN